MDNQSPASASVTATVEPFVSGSRATDTKIVLMRASSYPLLGQDSTMPLRPQKPGYYGGGVGGGRNLHLPAHAKQGFLWLPVTSVQELCESRGGRPGLSVLTSLLVSVDVKIY